MIQTFKCRAGHVPASLTETFYQLQVHCFWQSDMALNAAQMDAKTLQWMVLLMLRCRN